MALLRGLHSRSLLRIIVSKEKVLCLGLIIFCPFIFKYTEKNPMNFQRKLKIKPKSGCSQNSPQTMAEDRGGMKPGPWEAGGRQSKTTRVNKDGDFSLKNSVLTGVITQIQK